MDPAPEEGRKSLTPPRPNLPEVYVRDPPLCQFLVNRRGSFEEPLPPRPPPPLVYTSTLPPPAPKKHRSKSNDFKSKTLPARKCHKRDVSHNMATNEAVQSEECESLSTPSSPPAPASKLSPEPSNKSCEQSNNKSNTQAKTTNNHSEMTSSSGSETIFFTSFRKASSGVSGGNSLSAIGESPDLSGKHSNDSQVQVAVISMNGIRNDKVPEKGVTLEDESRKRKKAELQSCPESVKSKSCSPPSKRSSLENVKNICKMSSDEPRVTKAGAINMTYCCSKQRSAPEENMMTSQQQQPKYLKHPVAPESIASRVKHESQEQIRKLKKNVSMDECKTKSSVLHSTSSKQTIHESCSVANHRASSDSCSSISSQQSDKLTDKSRGGHKNINQPSHRMSPVLAIKNIIKKADKDGSNKRKKVDKEKPGLRKEAPIVLEDKYSKVLIRGGRDQQHSPTPSLASTLTPTPSHAPSPTPSSVTQSSLAPSNLSLLSDLLSENDYHTWLDSDLDSAHKNNFKGVVNDLDKYVADMIGFTQDIQSPRTSKLRGGKKSSSKEFDELIKILNHKKRQSTNLEMKKSLQTIIDFIGDKKEDCPQTDKVNFASLEVLEDSINEEAGDYFMDCQTDEHVATVRVDTLVPWTDVILPLTIVVEAPTDGRPVPSPRLKRKNRIEGCSPTPSNISTSSSRLIKSDSRVSITSFNSMIQDLCQHTADVEERVSNLPGNNTKAFNEAWLSSMKERMEILIQEKERNKNLVLDFRNQITTLMEQNSVLEEEKIKMLRNEESTNQIIEELMKKTANFNQTLEDNAKLNEHLKFKEKEIEKLKGNEQEIVSQKKQLNDKQEAINSLNGLVIKLNEDIDNLKSQQHNKNMQGTSELNSLRLSFDQMKSDKEELETENTKIAGDRNKLAEEAKKLNEELSNMKQKEEDLSLEIQNLKKQKEDEEVQYQNIIDSLKSDLIKERSTSESLKQTNKQLSDKDEVITKLKTDLKKRGILLKDAQNLVTKLQHENSKKTIIKQMRDQIEDLETKNLSTTRAKKNLENDIEELNLQLEDLHKTRQRLEEKYRGAVKENSDISVQLEDTEEELQEMLKKYKASVTEISNQQVQIQEQSFTIIELEHENERLKEKNSDLQYKVSQLENDTIDLSQHRSAKMKLNELEQKLDLELTNKFRMEHQNERLKDTISKLEKDADLVKFKAQADQEKHKKLLNQFRDLKEDYLSLQGKESDIAEKNSVLLKKIDISETENVVLKKDLELALKRIDDFHTAISSEMDSDTDTITFSGEEDIFSSNYTLSSESIANELLEAKQK